MIGGISEGGEMKVVLQVKVRAVILAAVGGAKGVGGEAESGLEMEVPQREQKLEVQNNR